MTLLKYMYIQTYLEYEKAKRCIIGADGFNLAAHSHKLGDDDATAVERNGKKCILASFHPIYLSSLLN